MKDALDLKQENVGKLFRQYFFPTLLGMLGMSAVTAVDGIFVGHSVGSDGIAAINIIVPVLMLMTGIGLMTGAGCSVVASIHLSRGRFNAARLNVTQALLFVTVITALLITAMVVFPDRTGRLLGASPHLLPLVKEYMLWNVLSWIFMIWTAVSLFAIRLDGAPKLAMACSLITAGLNVILDWLFMFPLGWGLMGAAFATSLSTAVGGLIAVIYLALYARRLRLLRPKLNLTSLRLTLRNLGYQCRIGSSALLGEATMAVLMFMGNRIFMHYLGDDGVGAFGIVCYYAPFIFMVGNAIAQSAQPIISYNFGLGARKRTRETETIALLTAVVCGLVTTAVFSLYPDLPVGLFVDLQNRAAEIAVAGFPFFATGFTAFIFNLTAIGYFQSVERIRAATLFALSRGFLLLIPSFLLLPCWIGIRGIWLAMPVAENLTALLIVAFYYIVRHQEKKQKSAR
ncbi:MATE family efflux transporter [uncultured Rikenella sp.]|mgnify:CR=1 FL=1|uniref:MATE family efflux transporter n=1 Tax=uncultured Rikenella sp. TaxID=368003 RepID=UPI0025D73206|nr:MATE family efflux transporter [uncultured Rikenella sp.]